MNKALNTALPTDSLWTIISYEGKNNNRSHLVKARCKCGYEKISPITVFRTGQSLGCHACRQKTRKRKHGDGVANSKKRHRLYRIWANMKHRCKTSIHYSHVKVCDEWIEYLGFKTWAEQNGYMNDLEIDRIDSLGNYEPINCRWIQHKDNNCNKLAKKNGKSKYIGVNINNTKFIAKVAKDNKVIYQKSFGDELEAAKARDQFILDNKLKYYRLNF